MDVSGSLCSSSASFVLAIFASVPQPQYENGWAPDFVAYLVVAHEDPANLSRLELLKLLAQTRMHE